LAISLPVSLGGDAFIYVTNQSQLIPWQLPIYLDGPGVRLICIPPRRIADCKLGIITQWIDLFENLVKTISYDANQDKYLRPLSSTCREPRTGDRLSPSRRRADRIAVMFFLSFFDLDVMSCPLFAGLVAFVLPISCASWRLPSLYCSSSQWCWFEGCDMRVEPCRHGCVFTCWF
jgi:hypothetical protein